MGKQHNDTTTTILDALMNVAGNDGWTQAEICKRTATPKSTVKRSLDTLVEEGSVEKFKNGKGFKYRAVVAEAVEATDDETSAEASEVAILAAEGMTPEQGAEKMEDLPFDADNPEPRESVVPDANGSAQPVDSNDKPRRRLRPTAHVARSAFDLAFELARDDEMEGEARDLFIENAMRKALSKLEPGDANKVIRSAQKKFAGYSSEFSDLLSKLESSYAPTRGKRSGGGSRTSVVPSDGTPSVVKVTLRRKRPMIHVRPSADDFAIGTKVAQRLLDADGLRALADKLDSGQKVIVCQSHDEQ